MRLIRMFLPHITISLAISLVVIVILDTYNPMMGFLRGAPFQVLVWAEALCSLATAILYICRPVKKRRKPRGMYEKDQKN